MAPEQIQARWREYGPWTDLYAVGALVWEYATGTKPYAGTSRAAMLVAPLVRELPEFEPIQPVPIDLQGWLKTMMGRAPNQRFMLAADAAEALRPMELPARGPLRIAMLGRASVDDPLSEWDPDEVTSITSIEDLQREVAKTKWDVGPELPERWQRPSDNSAATLGRQTPIGLGLGLFGLRGIPMVGRESIRDQLWSQLKGVYETRQAAVVMLRGPAGVGKSHLAEWLGQYAHSVGAISTFIRADHAPQGVDPRAGLRPALARHFGCVELPQPAAETHLREVLSWWGEQPEWLLAALSRWLLPNTTPPREPPAVLLVRLRPAYPVPSGPSTVRPGIGSVACNASRRAARNSSGREGSLCSGVVAHPIDIIVSNTPIISAPIAARHPSVPSAAVRWALQDSSSPQHTRPQQTQ